MLEVKGSIDPAMKRSLHTGGANLGSRCLWKLVMNVVKLLSPQIHKTPNRLIDHFIAPHHLTHLNKFRHADLTHQNHDSKRRYINEWST